jgi:predicted RND superfamily exporter protein
VSGALPGTLYAFVLVSALSLLMLWRLRESLLALLPLVLALAWTIGFMHLFGILSFAISVLRHICHEGPPARETS